MKKTFLSVLGLVIAFSISSQNSFASDSKTDGSFLIQKTNPAEIVSQYQSTKDIIHPRRSKVRKKYKTATCKRRTVGW